MLAKLFYSVVYCNALRGNGLTAEFKAQSCGGDTVANVHIKNLKYMSGATWIPHGDLKKTFDWSACVF